MKHIIVFPSFFRQYALIVFEAHLGSTDRFNRVVIPPSAPRAHFYCKVCVTAQKMRVGPSEPVCRSRLQITLSCIGKEPLW
jgi:hypothetical protein